MDGRTHRFVRTGHPRTDGLPPDLAAPARRLGQGDLPAPINAAPGCMWRLSGDGWVVGPSAVSALPIRNGSNPTGNVFILHPWRVRLHPSVFRRIDFSTFPNPAAHPTLRHRAYARGVLIVYGRRAARNTAARERRSSQLMVATGQSFLWATPPFHDATPPAGLIATSAAPGSKRQPTGSSSTCPKSVFAKRSRT